MINNYWEDKDMNTNIKNFHEVEMSKMELPKWMRINCPFCGKNLPLISIRTFSVKFNTRNIGDLAVEVICDECGKKFMVVRQEDMAK